MANRTSDGCSDKTAPQFVTTIDFGTTHCSVAYLLPSDVEPDLLTLDDDGKKRVPSCILFNPSGKKIAFGNVARDQYAALDHDERPQHHYFEHVKKHLQHEKDIDRNQKISALNGKQFFLVDVIAHILHHLKCKLLTVLKTFGYNIKASDIDWVITVPAIWMSRGREMMLEAGYMAGLCSDSEPLPICIATRPRTLPKERKHPKKMSLALEPVSAALHCRHQIKKAGRGLDSMVPNIVVDIGGGAVYIVSHTTVHGHIEEIAVLHRNFCGGTTVNEEFYKFLQDFVDDPDFSCYIQNSSPEKQARHKADLNKLIYTIFETEKKRFGSEEGRDSYIVEFPTSFWKLYEDSLVKKGEEFKSKQDKSVQVEDDGAVMRIRDSKMKEFFQPAINEIAKLIEEYLKETSIAYVVEKIYLVGGFGGCKYLRRQLEAVMSESFQSFQFWSPDPPELAVIRGATRFRCNLCTLLFCVVAKREPEHTYGALYIGAQDQTSVVECCLFDSIPQTQLVDSSPSQQALPTSTDTFDIGSNPQNERVDSPFSCRAPISTDRLDGLDVVGETTVLITHSFQDFHWKGYGLKLRIPEKALPADVKECTLLIRVGVSGQFALPKNTSLASGVYWLNTDPQCQFTKPLTLEIQHCAKSSQTSRLSFASCSQNSLPHTFEIMKEGKFPKGEYGHIQLHSSSLLTLLRMESWFPQVLKFGDHNMKYCARQYYLCEEMNRRVIHFFVTKDLEVYATKIQHKYTDRRATIGPVLPVDFKSSSISLQLPSEEVLDGGWKLFPLLNPEITKKDVDSYETGMDIPTSQLRAEWTKEGEPSRLTHKVILRGAMEPRNYYIELDSTPPGCTVSTQLKSEHVDSPPPPQQPPTSTDTLEDTSKPKFATDERGGVMKKVNPAILHVQRTDKTTLKAVQLFARQVVVVLHTCNDNEYWAALERMEPPTTQDGSNIRDHAIQCRETPSVIGWFGGYRAAVVRTEQGNKCRDELTKALTDSFPNAQVIIGAGIAYANNRERKFADVLISDQIENFVQYKIVDGKITNRGAREQIGPNVQRIFKKPAGDWTSIRPFHCADNDRTSKAHIGCIVSAPTLVQDEALKEQLMKHTPDCIGGEMEGWVLLEMKRALFFSCKRNVEVIIIKSVADYGDRRKGDDWQWTAAKAAMDCIHYCLEATGGTEFSAIDIAEKEYEEQKS